VCSRGKGRVADGRFARQLLLSNIAGSDVVDGDRLVVLHFEQDADHTEAGANNESSRPGTKRFLSGSLLMVEPGIQVRDGDFDLVPGCFFAGKWLVGRRSFDGSRQCETDQTGKDANRKPQKEQTGIKHGFLPIRRPISGEAGFLH
jgi:hypothetical protein